MTELSRVRQYVAKIKSAAAATTGPLLPTQQLDTQAAGRFIKAALAGNEEYDREKREREQREKAKAAEKLAAIEAGMKKEREVEGGDAGEKKKLKGKRKGREEVGEEKETKKKVKRSREDKQTRREKRKGPSLDTIPRESCAD
jgi:exosome complex protein LRP1